MLEKLPLAIIFRKAEAEGKFGAPREKCSEGIRPEAHALAVRLSRVNHVLLGLRGCGRVRSWWLLPLLQLLLLLGVALH